VLPQVIQWGMLLDKENVDSLLDARRVIEIGLAELAAMRRTPEDLALLEERLEQLRNSIDDKTVWVTADVNFHLQVAVAAHSPSLSDVLHRLRSLLDMSIWHNQAQHEENSAKFVEHERIFIAISEQDPLQASHTMREHMDRVGARLRADTGV
jgi:GntR family transcriptional repressor for pyruvate dehydrogenase complex